MLVPFTPLFSHGYGVFASLLALVLFCSHDLLFFWFFLDSSWFDTLWHSQPLCSYLSIAFLDGLVLLCILNLATLPPACFDALYFAPMHGPSAYAMHQPFSPWLVASHHFCQTLFLLLLLHVDLCWWDLLVWVSVWRIEEKKEKILSKKEKKEELDKR